MANRTVSVELTLKSEQYKAGIESSKIATEELDHKVEELDRDINKLPADAAKAAASIGVLGGTAKEVGNDVDDLGKKTETLGEKTRVSADDAGKLDARIAELKDSLQKLGNEFDRNGDPSLLKKFKSDSSELAGLTKMRKEFTTLADEAAKFAAESEKASMSVGDLFSGGLTSPVVLGGAAAAAPVVLGAAGGLTGVAAGAGVAAAGVAGAVAGNPEMFKAEWGTAIGEIKKDWIAASEPFTGPTLSAIRSVGPLVDSWHLDTMFAKAAGYVEPLVHAAEGFATGVEHGIADLVDKAGPEIAVFAADLPKIGDSIGQALGMISDNATGGAEALHALDKAVIDAVVSFGAIVSGAEAVSQGVTDASNSVKGFFDGIPGWVQVAIPPLALYKKLFDEATPDTLQAAEGAKTFGAAMDGVRVGTDGAIGAIDDFGNVGGGALYTLDQRAADVIKMVDRMEKSFDEAANAILRMRDADVAAAQGLADLEKGWHKTSNALDINTQKGRDNVSLIDKTISNYVKQRDAAIAAGGGTAEAYAKANAVYQQQIKNLEAELVKLGLSKQAAEDFLNAFKDKTITVTVKVNQVGSVSQQGVVSGGVPLRGAYAEGGDPPAGWSLVGERGPELVRFGGGEHVYTASQTRSMMAASPSNWGGGSGGAVAVTLQMASGANLTPLGTLFNQMLRDGLIVVKASQVRAA